MATHKFDRALVITASSVLQDLVDRFLRMHAHRIVGAATLAEGRRRADGIEATDLVVLDADIESRRGLELLEELSARHDAPAVVVIAEHPVPDCAARAASLGALGTLAKPLALGSFSALLRSSRRAFEPADPRFRVRPIAEAILLDPDTGEPLAQWEVQDISLSGAFLRTFASYAPGSIFELELLIADTRFSTSARVVRSQPPDWFAAPGLGVRFEFDAKMRPEFDALLERLSREPRIQSS